MLNIEGRWSAPINLVSDPRLIYECPEKNGVPKASGVYVFARRFGNSLVPVYIGEAADLRARLRQHLKGSVQLMKALNDAPSGARVFCIAKSSPKKGKTRTRLEKSYRTL
jgi:hypothetical protein